MDRRVISFLYVLIIGCLTSARAQLISPTAQLDSVLIKKGIMQFCPSPKYVSDTVAVRASLDSIAKLMTGRWSLQIIESGWEAARRPEKVVELAFDQQGRGTIYEDGQLAASIKLLMRRLWGMVRFDIKQEGNSIIKLSVSKKTGGLLGVCEEKLFISDGMGDGTLYAFRRLR